MPELAEVEYYRKQWSPCLGEKVAALSVHREKRVFREVDLKALLDGLSNQIFKSAERHGKQMCFRFGQRHYLGLHLGMTGKIWILGSDQEAGKHDHLCITMQSGRVLVFSDSRMFGRIRYACSASAPDWWQDLPPEPSSDVYTFEQMNHSLDRHARAPVKAVLLIQEDFPGVGNWMADEILWRSGIFPGTRAGVVGPKKRRELYRNLRRVCDDALRVIGTDWGRPPNSWLFNHRWKDGGRCPKTGKLLRRTMIGGRTTCWSPNWQRYRGKS